MPLQCNRKIPVWVLVTVPWLHCVLLHAQSTDTLLRGAASCAASGCHGGPRAAVAVLDAPRGSEYPLWLERDPHAQSWRTINSPASLQILEKLGIMRNGQIVDQAQFANCLACHNTDTETTSGLSLPMIAEGVGCEACHGPSAHWYDSHFRGPDDVQRARDELGLRHTKPLVGRAEMCARCHVGAEDRDMNHDIIAAGHPALYFDMAVYHERLPKHWRDDERSASQFRSQLWFAGQIAKLRAELELIEARATETLTVSCWPELSQYQCSSCHNQLDGQTPRLLSEAQVLTPVTLAGLGKAPTRLWNLGGWQVIDDALRQPGKTTSLEKSMVSLQDSLPDTRLSPVQIVERSREAIDRLDAALHSVSSEQRVHEWTLDQHRQWTITQLRQALNDGEWEQATLGYVAAWALIPSFDSDELRASLETMRSGLVFANRSQSPILPLKSDATFQKDKDLSTHAAPPKHAAQPKQVTQPKQAAQPTQAEWRSAVETVIALIDRSEP